MMVTHDDVGAAIGRLVDVARSDTGQARRCATFLLAWWSGDDWGHWPIADLFGVDAPIADDMVLILGFLGRHGGAIYADAWGYRDAMGELVDQWRPEAEVKGPKPRTIGDLDLSVRLVNVLGASSPATLVGEVLADANHPTRRWLSARLLAELAEVQAEAV